MRRSVSSLLLLGRNAFGVAAAPHHQAAFSSATDSSNKSTKFRIPFLGVEIALEDDVYRRGVPENPGNLYMPAPAEEFIHEVPPKVVHGSSVACDGGGGALGHPRIYINLDKPGPHTCGYCGLRFLQAEQH